tara:strand:+ start:136 stop:456 length:321 start_codon:yes stop_codon:yes gene_type:complete
MNKLFIVLALIFSGCGDRDSENPLEDNFSSLFSEIDKFYVKANGRFLNPLYSNTLCEQDLKQLKGYEDKLVKFALKNTSDSPAPNPDFEDAIHKVSSLRMRIPCAE